MHNLTVRIFLSFWLIIGLLIGMAAIGGYAYSERLREAYSNFEVDDTASAASEALETGGTENLTRWLRELPSGDPFDVYIVDRNGTDLLDRPLPGPIRRMVRRFDLNRDRGRGARDWSGGHRPQNLRRARPFSQLRGPDGAVYSLFAIPKRDPWREWIAERAGPAFFLLAIIVSTCVSYVLARAIARPVQTFREATLAIADGRLDTRVAESMRNRRDEIGLLAHDLDAMAGKLESAAEQQTELSRNISHELRSPLARLRVALELARRQSGDLTEFARIETEAERLDNLIGQLLSYSRMDTKSDDAPQTIDLAECLEEVVENVNFECRSSGIDGVTVVMKAAANLKVQGYASAVTSAFENVIRNAVRHSPKDAVVDALLTTDDNTAIIAIADRGPGVKDEELEQIFQPFYRSVDAEDTTDSRSAGSGLGLAIARRAVEKNGGSIAAMNRPGGGLEVKIELPGQ